MGLGKEARETRAQVENILKKPKLVLRHIDKVDNVISRVGQRSPSQPRTIDRREKPMARFLRGKKEFSMFWHVLTNSRESEGMCRFQFTQKSCQRTSTLHSCQPKENILRSLINHFCYHSIVSADRQLGKIALGSGASYLQEFILSSKITNLLPFV